MCSNFAGSQSNHLTSYQKIPLVSLFGYRYLLNFICQTMNFHNCWHANVHVHKIFRDKALKMSYFLIISPPILRQNLSCPQYL